MKDQLHSSPLAVTSDGTVVANLAHFNDMEDLQEAIQRALQLGRLLFISVALTPEEADFIRKRIDDSGADALAWLLGKTKKKIRGKTKKDPEGAQPTENATVRKSRRTAS